MAPALLPLIQANRVRLLAVTSAQRLDGLKSLPTVAESGYPGFEALAWNGLVRPAGTPAEFRSFIDQESRHWGAIIKRVGISLD